MEAGKTPFLPMPEGRGFWASFSGEKMDSVNERRNFYQKLAEKHSMPKFTSEIIGKKIIDKCFDRCDERLYLFFDDNTFCYYRASESYIYEGDAVIDSEEIFFDLQNKYPLAYKEICEHEQSRQEEERRAREYEQYLKLKEKYEAPGKK